MVVDGIDGDGQFACYLLVGKAVAYQLYYGEFTLRYLVGSKAFKTQCGVLFLLLYIYRETGIVVDQHDYGEGQNIDRIAEVLDGGEEKGEEAKRDERKADYVYGKAHIAGLLVLYALDVLPKGHDTKHIHCEEYKSLSHRHPKEEPFAFDYLGCKSNSKVDQSQRVELHTLLLPPRLGYDPTEEVRKEHNHERHCCMQQRREYEAEHRIDLIGHEKQRETTGQTSSHYPNETALEHYVVACPRVFAEYACGYGQGQSHARHSYGDCVGEQYEPAHLIPLFGKKLLVVGKVCLSADFLDVLIQQREGRCCKTGGLLTKLVV